MKTAISIAIFVALLLSARPVFAGLGWDDPAECVDGQWVVVNAAAESAVIIRVPRGMPYGENGGCLTPAPAPVFQTNPVRETDDLVNSIKVIVDGSQASSLLTVSYGDVVQTVSNNGNSRLKFRFDLP